MSKIAVILAPSFADLGVCLVLFAAAVEPGGRSMVLRCAISRRKKAISFRKAAFALWRENDVSELAPWRPGVIAVIGGAAWETPAAPDIDALLGAQHASGCVVAGICGGTLALARAGLLNDARHTSNDPDFLASNADMQHYDGAPLYEKSPAAVADGGVVTAPGTAPVSFTAAVFEAAGVAAEAVLQFVEDDARSRTPLTAPAPLA